jgi:hypothetical protein
VPPTPPTPLPGPPELKLEQGPYDVVHTRTPLPPSFSPTPHLPPAIIYSTTDSLIPYSRHHPRHHPRPIPCLNMDKIKEKLHIGSRRKSQPENDFAASTHNTHGSTSGTIEDNYGA